MRLVRRVEWRASSGRGRSSGNREAEGSYESVVESKWRRLNRYMGRYRSDNKFAHEDKLYEQILYGNSIHISGVTACNFESAKLAKSVMKSVKPNLLLLGGVSDNFCRAWESVMGARQKYDHPLLKTERMQCKDRITRLIQSRLQDDPDLYWDDHQKEMVVIDHEERRILPADYLTAAHLSSFQDHTKVAFAKPSDTLVFEDLIMRWSVQDLRGLVERAAGWAMQQESDSWRLSYTREAIRHYVMTQEPDIFSRELTFQAALVRRYAKVETNILLLTPTPFVQRVADQLHHVQFAPEAVYRVGLTDRHSEGWGLVERTVGGSVQEVLQKFALVSILKENWIENEFAGGVNVFKYMSFSKLFAGMPLSELQARYAKAREAVEQPWFALVHQRLNNVQQLGGAHIRLSLENQLELQRERASAHFPYAYEQKNYHSLLEEAAKLERLTLRMQEMVNEEGDKHNIELLDRFLRGQRSRDGIILYSKLLGRANVEAEDRLKLPVFHYAAFRGIYKEYLRDFLLRAQESSQVEDKLRKRMSKLEEMMEKNMKKLDDPEQLHNYVTGKMGKALHINFDPDDGPSFSPEDLQYLQQLVGEPSPEDEQELNHQHSEHSQPNNK